MLEVIKGQLIYFWYYFEIQFKQIFIYWLIGIIIGSVISVFAKEKIHNLFLKMKDKDFGILGIFIASILGIISSLCMYGTIPLLLEWLNNGMSMGAGTAFMVTGPATKITNLGALKIVLGIKNFIIYLIFVMLFAMMSGMLIDLVRNNGIEIVLKEFY